MIVPVAAGKNRVEIVFAMGNDRKVGWGLSAAALAMDAIALLRFRKYAAAPA
jgi:hypothetical protein